MKNNRKRFLRGSITSYVNMFSSILINILLVPLMLNGLGKYSYGLWVTVSSLFGFMIITDLGLGQSATKLIAEQEDQFSVNDFISKELVSTTFFTNLIIGILILIINCVLSFYVFYVLHLNSSERYSISLLYCLLSLSFFITFISSTFKNVLVGYKYISTNNLINIVRNIFNFILIFVAFKISKQLYIIAVIQIVLALFNWVVSLCAIKFHKIKIEIKIRYFSLKTFRRIFKPGVYYLILQVAGLLAGNTDNLILNYFLSASIVALFSSAYKLSNIFMQLIFTIVDNLFPFISEMEAKNNNEKLKSIFIISEKLTIYIGVILAFTLILFGKPIMEVWIGKGNYIGDVAMTIFTIYILMNIINHVPIVFLQGMNRHSVLAKLSLIEALINVFLSIIFVKLFGGYGAILGTVVADVALMFWYSTYKIVTCIDIRIKELINILKPSIFLMVCLLGAKFIIELFSIKLASNIFALMLDYSIYILFITSFSFCIGLFKVDFKAKKLIL